MTTEPARAVLRCVRQALAPEGDPPTDGELLTAFLARGDGAAFAALVRRHGPMVLGLCRRLLRHHHDAEDAFQATFLVLARKASSIHKREAVGDWLYGVARRTALKAAAAARRRKREVQVTDMPEPLVDPPTGQDELLLLDEELGRLPENYRLPVVLCELQGRPRREVARQLGLPEGTLSSRLAAARRLLARRLGRRGLALPAAALAAALSRHAAASVPPALVGSTVNVATRAGPIPAPVAALAEGVVKAMFLGKLRVIALLLLAGLLLGGVVSPDFQARAVADKEAPGQPRRQPQKFAAVLVLRAHEQDISHVVFSPDGKTLASAAYDGTVKLWDARTGQWVRTLKVGRAVVALAFSPDSKTVATAHNGAPGEVQLWDARSGELHKRVKGFKEGVYALAYSPGGRTLAVGSGVAPFEPNPKGDRPAVIKEPVGYVALFDLKSGKITRTLEGAQSQVVSLAFARGTPLVAGGSWGGAVQVWDARTGKRLWAAEGGKSGPLTPVVFSPDGTLLAGGGRQVVNLWEAGTGRLKRVLKGHRHDIYGIAFAPGGGTLASTDTFNLTVKLWDVRSGELRQTLTGQLSVTRAVAIAPDGKTLAGGSGVIPGKQGGYAEVRLWPLATGPEK